MRPRDPDPELARPEAAGWVLGVLDGFDADRFGGHLRSCPDCQAAVAELGPAARVLHGAAPAAVPPPGLQARTLASVAAAGPAPEWLRGGTQAPLVQRGAQRPPRMEGPGPHRSQRQLEPGGDLRLGQPRPV